MIAETKQRSRKKRILFIAGAWRSGSTLLGDLLGSVPGICHVGELHHVWSRGLARNWLCGCGERFRSCGFWGRVIAEIGGDAEDSRARKLEEQRLAMSKTLQSKVEPERVRAAYSEYVEAVGNLAGAVFRASDAETIVDSSKSFRHGCTLLASCRAQIEVVHLVRDPRAVVYSMVERPKQRVDDPRGSAMLRPDLDSAIRLWVRSNYEAERLGELAGRYFLLRYEDLVADPTGALQRIVQRMHQPASARSLRLTPQHTISGNPDRLRAGNRKEIRMDDEWSSRMDVSMRELIEERTLEGMHKYGYASMPAGASQRID